MDENTIVVTDELGNEVEYEILFTFENEENGHQYVVYFDPEKDEPEAQAAIFDDEGGLFPIETPEEWELVEEVFQSFVSEERAKEVSLCVLKKAPKWTFLSSKIANTKKSWQFKI